MFEPAETPARSEKDEKLEEKRRKIFAEKIALFEKTTPKKSKKTQGGFMKKTPKMERSSHHRKVNGTNGKETGKMQEGLRLGRATACSKIGNKCLKVTDNLAVQGRFFRGCLTTSMM